MNILLTGSRGLVGSALIPALQSAGHHVTRLVRNSPPSGKPGEVSWEPQAGRLDTDSLEGVDAVIHLAGATISERWTARNKAAIRASRVKGTQLLCDRLAAMRTPPRVLISASAVGYYGGRGDEAVTETSAPGTGFLSEVCLEWEGATQPAVRAGIRTVLLRLGVVLSRRGGALAKMLPPFRMGVGGRLGSGRQYMSWIAMDDVVGGTLFALDTASFSGPVNAVAPNAVTNAEFTKALGKVLHRPTIFPVPAFGVQLLFGEMGRELLLSGARVLPERLSHAGYRFQYPEIEGALRHVLAA